MNNARQSAARLAVVFCAGLLLFAGCKDLFHEKPEEPDEPNYQYPNQYTVTFDADGGSPSTMRTVRDGNTVGYSNMPSDPTRSGYSFGGWYTSRNGGGSQFTYSSTINRNMTVYAYWTISQYTVTFDADGGSPATQTRGVNGGTSVGSANMPSEPTRSGYGFGGWYTEADGGGSEFTYSSTVNGNMTVYAYWTISGFSGISNITYSSVLGGEWTLQNDGRRQSPWIADNGVTKARIRFTSTVANASIMIQLFVSSEERFDWAFISTLDNADATYESGYYSDSVISGENSVTVTIPVPTVGSHFIDIGYRKDGSQYAGSDCAWFKVITGSSVGETIPDTSLQAALAWLDSNAVEGGSYTITLQNDETIAPKTLFYSGKTVGIILTGGTSERTVNLSTTGSLFSVESGVTLTLDNNITLQGRSDNTVSLVQVNSGGALVMNTGSKVSGNTNTPSYGDSPRGGGIYNTGNFTMNGGEISGNTAQYVTYGADGGGIYNTGNFTMNDGKISNNTAVYGGGVYIGGTFTMNGGEISGNNAVASSHGGYPGIGGGIYAIYTTVTMTNGNICDNTAGAYGGGIYTFGTDSSSASFTMNGGTISGNTAPRGGGVYVSGNSTLTKQSGGTIYGSNASDTLKNTATYGDSYGHAVYVYADSGSKLRNTTADSGITLDSTVSGAIGGWEFPAHSVQISLQPVSDGPQLENISLFANESAQFFAGSGYTSWTWYWNGDPISGMASSTYTLAAYSKTPGIYELSVVVTTSAGHKLSARCRVVVKAN